MTKKHQEASSHSAQSLIYRPKTLERKTYSTIDSDTAVIFITNEKYDRIFALNLWLTSTDSHSDFFCVILGYADVSDDDVGVSVGHLISKLSSIR